MRWRGCAAAALALALAGPAHAVSFSQADPDGDGGVTYPEARRVFPRLSRLHFERCDPNGDGVLDKYEFPLLNNFYSLIYLQRD